MSGVLMKVLILFGVVAVLCLVAFIVAAIRLEKQSQDVDRKWGSE